MAEYFARLKEKDDDEIKSKIDVTEALKPRKPRYKGPLGAPNR
jgi:hypothetical protein